MQEYGDIREPRHDKDTESLNLAFWPSSVPLRQRWRNNGLSADFLGDYVTTFFPLDENTPATQNRRAEIQGAVEFIANELLENAMKFHDQSLPEPITLHLNLDKERITLQETNGTDNATAERFQVFIQRVTESDPDTLYMETLEKSATSENTSGLGYLTMINDYGAELAWRFETLPSGGCRVTTQVTIEI